MSVERYVYSSAMAARMARQRCATSLGGKGAGLAEMANLGLPVPPGFTILAKLWHHLPRAGTFPAVLRAEVDRHLKHLERVTKKVWAT